MKTECTAAQLEFHGLGRRAVVGQFDGGPISSDDGGLLLRKVERPTHMLKRLAGCFVDYGAPEQVEHPVESLIKQRVMGLALGYEDLNDHDALRQDPLLAVLSDVADPTGAGRRRAQDKGCALEGKSTLNRLKLTPLAAPAASRYKKVVADAETMDELLMGLFLEAHETTPAEIVVDVDATNEIRCTGTKKVVSSTATTATTDTCRCTSSAAKTCCVLVCAKPIKTVPPVAKRNWRVSSGASA